MSTATANISSLDSNLPLDERAEKKLDSTSGSNVALLTPPRNRDDSLNAIAARRAGRVNAASIKEAEVDKLHAERKSLINKKFLGVISNSEERRLALVRWNLDRIQDARHGETLDALESAVSLYESIGEEISFLMKELERHAPKGRR